MEKANLKKHKVVMLPTSEKAQICKFNDSEKLLFASVPTIKPTTTGVKYHLYILSDEEIKEGDCVYHPNKIYKCIGYYDNKTPCVRRKIIATTDTSLFGPFSEPYPKGVTNPIPSPSNSFIKKFIEEYNKGNIITKVMVEYDKNWIVGTSIYGHGEYTNELKINPKDNTITIRPIKDSWTREEVVELFRKLEKERSQFYPEDSYDLVPLENWIKEHL